ncbi:MAG TPA: DUF4426 domain-containing protein, partial [Gammaproteobacteria bacterium]
MKPIARICMFIVSVLLCTQALAQNEYEISFGDYTVNYNTFPSTFLDPTIAKSVGINRSDNRGVITIVIRHGSAINGKKAVKATVSGMATNLIGQLRKLKFTEVREGEALYYIGDFALVKDENLTFDITVIP